MIEFREVSCVRGDKRVLEEVSLTFRDGEFVLLVGPNGVGKTTVLDLCSGLVLPETGEIRVNETSTNTDPVGARTGTGRVFESPGDQIVGETIGADVAFGPENLGRPRAEIHRRVSKTLEIVGLSGREDESVHTLSGGETARLAIAGALAMEPDHLLLDEPTVGIDQPGRMQILSHLADLHADGMGIVLATHDLRDLGDLADRVLALGDGSVVMDTAPCDTTSLAALGVRQPHDWPSA